MLSVSDDRLLDHMRFTVDHRKQNPSWAIWDSPALFPLFNGPAR
jgi:hypothetical protein